MKASQLLKYLPASDANATGHGLDLVKVYRSYKNSPHNIDALYLKYLVHRMENGAKYESVSPLRRRGMDIAFLIHHQKGKAAEKNGHINADDLKRFIENPDTIKLAKQLVNHKQKLNNFILKEHPDHILNINGEPHLRLTRGLGVNREQRGEEHTLASYADIPNPPFGGENPTHHHQHVPLKNIWFTYDYGPKEASSEKFGPENEFVVSPHKVIYNEDHQNDPTKQILVRNHHSLKTNNNLGFASVVNKLSLSDIDKIIEKAPLAAEYLSKHPLLNSSHIDKIVEKNPYAAAQYLSKHPLFNSSHIDKIIEKEPYAAVTYFKKHPLFNSSHIDKIVEKNPYAAAYHLNKHPLLNAGHIDKIVENEPYAAIEYLKDHKEFNSGHIDKIVENDPYAAIEYLKDHKEFNSGHIDKIVENEPYAAAVHLNKHPLLNSSHINKISEKDPEAAAKHLKDHPYYIQKYGNMQKSFKQLTNEYERLTKADKPSQLLKYLPKPNINEEKHGLNLIEVYRSYKNSPHNIDALYLKYLVHRLENGEKYHSTSPEEQQAMDKAFLEHHQKGKAAEKNGSIDQNDLKSFIENPDTIKLARQLINHKEKLNNFILNEHPDHIVDINGEPHLRLTRALSVNREQRGEEHALASYADHSFPPFGGNTPTYHHQYVPLKNIWFTYDYGPKKASSEQHGPENEFIVSNHKIVYNENHKTSGTSQILVRNHHSLDRVNRPEFASFYKNFKNLTKDELNEILSGKFKFDLKIPHDTLHHLIKVNDKDSLIHKYAAENRDTHPDILHELIHKNEANSDVHRYAAGNRNIHPDDLRWLIQNNKAGSYVHVSAAGNRNIHQDDLRELIQNNKAGSAEHYFAAGNLSIHTNDLSELIQKNAVGSDVHQNAAGNPNIHTNDLGELIQKNAVGSWVHRYAAQNPQFKNLPPEIQQIVNPSGIQKIQKSFKQLTNEYERLKKSEEFKDLTPDDLLNKDIIQRIQKKRVNSSFSEKEQLDSYIENAMQKALLNTYHDPQYPEKLSMAWSNSPFAVDAQRELKISPRNWLTKTPSGEYDVDTNKLKDTPFSFSALKHIKDMSPENAKKIMEKLKDSPELSEWASRTAREGALRHMAKFAPLEALLDKNFMPDGAYEAIKEKTNDFTEHPISLNKLKELHGKHYADDTSYVGRALSNYVLSHPDTPKEDLLNHIQNDSSPSIGVLTHKSLSPEDIKHAVRLRLANQNGVLDYLTDVNTKEKVDKGLAALDALHEHAKTSSAFHEDMANYGYHKLALGDASEEVAEHTLNKLLERYNNKEYLSKDPKVAAAIRHNLAHSINSVIHPDSPSSQKALIEIAKGTHSIKDKTGKIKENDLLDNILNTRRFRTDRSQNFVNEVRRHVIESGHAPSVQRLYKQWNSALGEENQKAELEHLTNKFDDKTLAKIVPHMDAGFLRENVFSNQELSQKILPHLSPAAKSKLERDGALGGISKKDAPLSFSSNTEMLRKLRDVAEANGGSVSAKQLGQHGLNENALKITHLKDAKGNYTKEAIQKHIDSLPKHTYDYSHTTWKGAQVHSDEKQYVFQLNHNEDLLNEMKNAGVYDTFAKVHELSFESKHPVKDNTLGWVRYTKGKDGHIHIDEIQSDLGRSLHGSIKEYLDKQPDSPKKKKMEELFSKEKIDKMNDILFKGQHPSKIIHEGFLQFLRNNGNVGKDIHIWQAMPKAKLAGQNTVGSFSLEDLSDNIKFHKKVEANKPIEDFDAGEVEQAARAFVGPHTSNELYKKHAVYSPGTATQGPEEISFNLEGYKNDVVSHPLYKLAINHIKAHATNDDLASAIEPLKEKENNFGRVHYPYTVNELPVHMKIGYQELPPKLDYTPDSYGKIQTQKTAKLKDQPTWKTNLRKSLKALTAEYERLTKADRPTANSLLKYLPAPDMNATGHGLDLVKVYRSYKNSPHNVDALYLKYLVHRMENGKKYHSASPEEQKAMDKAFLEHHKKSHWWTSFINTDTLHYFIHNPDTIKLAKQLVNHKQKLNNFILKEHPEHIVNINGEPHLRLTRGLGVNREERGEEHALASYADQPDPPFGGIRHHQFVPLKNIWYTYDYGPKETSSGKALWDGGGIHNLAGTQNEFLVSPHKVVYNENHEADPTKQILVREHHKLTPGNNIRFKSFKNKNLSSKDIDKIIEKDPKVAAEHLSNHPIYKAKYGNMQKSFKQLTNKYERLTKADKPIVKLNPEHGKMIADAYHNMKHDPSHPEVKASYDALINETKQQYKDLLKQGYKFTRITDPDFRPYKNSKEMHADIENNKHLYYYPTSMGFGSEDSIPHDHPMLAPTEFTSHDGEQMVANDVFRQVHDINGHFLGGKTTFSPTGEHQSYLQHKKMYSNLAGKALATETMGQNSWVWAGPHGEHNRKNPANTIYAPQRAGLLPDEIINGKWHQ